MVPSFFLRSCVVSACLLAGAGVLVRASQSEIIPVRVPLSQLPFTLGTWQGRALADFDQSILDVLGVDEYVNRVYAQPGNPVAALYVGFYQSQRQGDTMHSPLNCLPGAGWIPIEQRRIQIPVREGEATRQIEINSFIIEKGLDRQAVLYWYQGQGRVVASEYWGRAFLILDAMRRNRTDGAMVRVVVPIEGRETAQAREAEATAIAFTQELYPRLAPHLPS